MNKRERKFKERLMIWTMMNLFPQTWNLLRKEALLYVFWRQRNSDQDDHEGKKSCKEPTEDPKIQIK